MAKCDKVVIYKTKKSPEQVELTLGADFLERNTAWQEMSNKGTIVYVCLDNRDARRKLEKNGFNKSSVVSNKKAKSFVNRSSGGQAEIFEIF